MRDVASDFFDGLDFWREHLPGHDFQPWLIYGMMRTEQGFSTNVSAGNSLFTLIGFMGMYALLSILFLLLMYPMLKL